MVPALYLLIGCFWTLSSSGAVGTLTSNPAATNGVLTLCPGDFVSITCTHEHELSGVTRWDVRDSDGADCGTTVLHSVPTDTTCGQFTITLISDLSGPTFSSTAQTTATGALDGAIVECFSTGLQNSRIGTLTIIVVRNLPTPTISSVEQVSQSVVRVSLSVTDSQCVDSYQVEATPVGGSGSTNTSSPASIVDVSGLDVCQYNYNFVGSLFASYGAQSELSLAVIYSANLSVLRGITVTVNQMDPLIEWVQIDNPLYPTCITSYVISDQLSDRSITVNSITRSLTTQHLNAAGFPYCTSISPTVTPITPIGPLMSVQGSIVLNTFLRDPDFPTPTLQSFVTTSGTITLHISIEEVSSAEVPMRNYQYTFNGTTTPLMSFTGNSFDIEIPETKEGQVVIVTVLFTRDLCTSMTSSLITYMDNTSSITLPTTQSIIPSTAGNFPSPFPSGGCGISCIAGVAVAVVVILSIVIILIVVGVFMRRRKTRKYRAEARRRERVNRSTGNQTHLHIISSSEENDRNPVRILIVT